MPGITRIHIDSDWSRKNDWRLELARVHEPIANQLYETEFARLGMKLSPGVDIVTVNKEEAAARYDWSEGIDVILKSENGARMTLQEKFLTYHESTVTFEESKNSHAQGAWYYCTAQYYFVGYTRQYWNWIKREVVRPPIIEFQNWMLVDFPAIRRADAAGRIRWEFNSNRQDGRRAVFRYAYFSRVPDDCIVAQCRPPTPIKKQTESEKRLERQLKQEQERLRQWNSGVTRE